MLRSKAFQEGGNKIVVEERQSLQIKVPPVGNASAEKSAAKHMASE